MDQLDRQMQNALHIKVSKTPAFPGGPLDDRSSLCGSPVQREGREQFFIVPAHQEENIRASVPHYVIGKKFLDKTALTGMPTDADKAEEVGTEEVEAAPARNKGGRPRKAVNE